MVEDITFNEVKAEELCSINLTKQEEVDNLIGLAFSGGGIRSATVNLGVLQGLAKESLINKFHYLSTVSGGGYIGAWFSALLHRKINKKEDQEKVSNLEALNIIQNELKASINPIEQQSTQKLTATQNAIRWLRNYSNYLTPFGLRDTLSAITQWVSNTLLNQVLLFTSLVILLVMFNQLMMIFLSSLLPIEENLISTAIARISEYHKLALCKGSSETIASYVFFSLALLLSILELYTPWKPSLMLHNVAPKWSKWFPIEVVVTIFFIVAIYRFSDTVKPMFEHAHGSQIIIKHDCLNKIIDLIFKKIPICLVYLTISIIFLLPIVKKFDRFSSTETVYKFLATLWFSLACLIILSFAAFYMHFPELLTSLNVLKDTVSQKAANYLPTFFTSMNEPSLVLGIVFWLCSFAIAKFGQNTFSSKSTHGKMLSLVIKAAPYLVLIFITLSAGYLAHKLIHLKHFLFWISVLIAIFFTGSLCFDINSFSLHNFYRYRLTRCYLGASRSDRRQHLLCCTNFSKQDDINFANLDGQQPIHIINTTLNITNGKALSEEHRQGASFFFTPQHSGFDIEGEKNRTGLVKTNGYVYKEGPKLGSLIAVSGAAASSNMGYHTNTKMAFVMTIFNARLGRWFGNPTKPAAAKRSNPRHALKYLCKELLSDTDHESDYLYLSDGGHFENLGIYELVRRECKVILVVDAGQDANYSFEDLGNAIRKCKVDFNVSIDIDVNELHPKTDSKYGNFKHANSHLAIGTVNYPDRSDGSENKGILLYIKNSLTGNEPADIMNYKLQHDDFPHRTTADQFFDEAEFESYRHLGEHMIEDNIKQIKETLTNVPKKPINSQYIENLKKEIDKHANENRMKTITPFK